MPFVTASLYSKLLHRVAGWRYLAEAYDETPDELDHADLAGLPSFRTIQIHNQDCGQARLAGLPDEYPRARWMFDGSDWGAGFTQIYSRPDGNSTDIYIYLPHDRENVWGVELDAVLRSTHLEIELGVNKFLGKSERHIDRHGGTLLTFRAVPELSVLKRGPDE